MSCFYPRLVRQDSLVTGSKVQTVPCGRCRGCRLDRSRDWALRCINEAQMNEDNCFVTLTYNNENLPKDQSVDKHEMTKFIERLRDRIKPREIKFYGCGEYGAELGRPHYHVLIFGYDFEDKVVHHVENPKKRNRFSSSDVYKVYVSAILSELWSYGFSTVGEITVWSCGYVARYIQKKITGDPAIEHYGDKKPEFALMSRRPGIGHSWIKKYLYDIYPKDFLMVNGKRFRPPRYYDAVLMRHNWEMYESVKDRRESKKTDDDLLRRQQKDKYLKNVTKTLTRRLESYG